ncbi:MmcB family DNA repair protein [Paramylibacter ulvae]|uniref:MmcB family DNA repair protein n=1 Tax=Paramylibacter ulvae TaxID=1651968 RepID=UPI0027E423C0|nr:MmcB family DNA repair protein [Amylibacter ulvae]
MMLPNNAQHSGNRTFKHDTPPNGTPSVVANVCKRSVSFNKLDRQSTQTIPLCMVHELQAGQILARGVQRLLHEMNFASITEFIPTRGLRVDVMAITPKGEIWIVECKSSRTDFASDNKWQGYLDWCDKFFFAIPPDFSTDILPTEYGLIFADSYGGAIHRPSSLTTLNAARRKKIALNFARCAAQRLHQQIDPRI